MFMGVNGQLNQTDVLQTLMHHIQTNPGADVLSPLTLEQAFSTKLEFDYKVGANDQTVRGRLFRRAFLVERQISFPVGVPEHAEEYFCELVRLFAEQDIQIEEIGYAKFTDRHLPAEVLAGVKRPLDPQWLTMKEQYFLALQRLDQKIYANELARFVVKFYTQVKQLPADTQNTMLQLMQLVLGKNALAWGFVLNFVDDLKQKDQSPKAPWVAESDQFNHYIDQFTTYLSQLGFTFNTAHH